MKVLFVGNCNHYFNRKLVEELKSYNSELTIDFFSIVTPDQSIYLPYNNTFDYSIDRKEVNFIYKLRGLFSVYCYRKWKTELIKLVSKNNYDYVHIQGLSLWHVGLDKYHDKIILTVWGSDFLRLSRVNLKSFKKLIKKAYKITLATEEMSLTFDKIYGSKAKHIIVRFGLNVFDKIDNLRNSNLSQKTDKIVITIGYNKHPAQQHLKILDQINKVDKSLVDKIELKLPLTYGPNNVEYINQIKEQVYKLECKYTFYEQFLSEEEMANLCIDSDIMIQLQTTDAFSGSMQEYMYAGNVVVTGKWLNYNSLKKEGILFYEIEQFEELSQTLNKIIQNFKAEKERVKSNYMKLHELSSWDANINKWNNLYKEYD